MDRLLHHVGEHDHAHARDPLELRENVESRCPREHHIQQHDVRAALLGKPDARIGRRREHNLEPRVQKLQTHVARELGFIIDEKYSRLVVHNPGVLSPGGGTGAWPIRNRMLPHPSPGPSMA